MPANHESPANDYVRPLPLGNRALVLIRRKAPPPSATFPTAPAPDRWRRRLKTCGIPAREPGFLIGITGSLPAHAGEAAHWRNGPVRNHGPRRGDAEQAAPRDVTPQRSPYVRRTEAAPRHIASSPGALTAAPDQSRLPSRMLRAGHSPLGPKRRSTTGQSAASLGATGAQSQGPNARPVRKGMDPAETPGADLGVAVVHNICYRTRPTTPLGQGHECWHERASAWHRWPGGCT